MKNYLKNTGIKKKKKSCYSKNFFALHHASTTLHMLWSNKAKAIC